MVASFPFTHVLNFHTRWVNFWMQTPRYGPLLRLGDPKLPLSLSLFGDAVHQDVPGMLFLSHEVKQKYQLVHT